MNRRQALNPMVSTQLSSASILNMAKTSASLRNPPSLLSLSTSSDGPKRCLLLVIFFLVYTQVFGPFKDGEVTSCWARHLLINGSLHSFTAPQRDGSLLAEGSDAIRKLLGE